MRLPRTLGRFVGRDAFVEYLERYAALHHIAVQPHTPVSRIDRGAAGFRLRTDSGDIDAGNVVVATGHQHTPAIPDWPGRDGYRGRLLHSSDYGNASAFAGRRVPGGRDGQLRRRHRRRARGRRGAPGVGRDATSAARSSRGRRSACPHSCRAWRCGTRRRLRPTRSCGSRAGRSSAICAASGSPRRPRDCSPSTGAPARCRCSTWASSPRCAAGRFRLVAAVSRSTRPPCGWRTAPRSLPTRSSPATGFRPGSAGWSATWTCSTHSIVRSSMAAAGRPSVPGLWFTGYRNPISGALRELRREAPGPRPGDPRGTVTPV